MTLSADCIKILRKTQPRTISSLHILSQALDLASTAVKDNSHILSLNHQRGDWGGQNHYANSQAHTETKGQKHQRSKSQLNTLHRAFYISNLLTIRLRSLLGIYILDTKNIFLWDLLYGITAFSTITAYTIFSMHGL